MHFRKKYTSCSVYKSLYASGLLLISFSANAANHDLSFTGWTVTNGQISENGNDGTSVCANTTYDCKTVAAGAGFKQIQVTNPPATAESVSGGSYIGTIVTDQNASSSPGADNLGFYEVSREDVSDADTIVTDQNASSSGNADNLGFYDVSFVKKKLNLVKENEPFLFIPTYLDNNISIISGSKGETLYTLPVGEGPVDVALPSSTNKVFVLNRISEDITIIDLEDYLNDTTLAVGALPRSIVLTADNKTLIVTNSGDNTISLIDTETLSIISTIDVGNLPTRVVVSSNNERVYVFNKADGSLSIISLQLLEVIETQTLADIETGPIKDIFLKNDRIYFQHMAYDSAELVLGAFDLSTNEVSMLEDNTSIEFNYRSGSELFLKLKSNKELSDFTMDLTQEPENESDQAVNPILNTGIQMFENKTYIVNSYNDELIILDNDTKEILNTVKTGAFPTAYSNFIATQSYNINSEAEEKEKAQDNTNSESNSDKKFLGASNPLLVSLLLLASFFYRRALARH